MTLRLRMDWVGTTLLAALGASPLGCGGSTFEGDGTGSGGGGSSNGSGGSGPGSGAGGLVSTGSGGFISSGGVVTGGAAGENQFPCLNPTPVLDDPSNGFVTCSNGYVHRTHQAQCPARVPRPDPVANYDPASDQCQYDSDCTAEANGYCGRSSAFDGDMGGRGCVYGCRNDSECAAGAICACGDPVGRCVAASCRTDADCAPSFNCASYVGEPGCPTTQYGCQTPADVCSGSQHCGEGMTCSLLGSEFRRCMGPSCVIGRPFLVRGEARRAKAAFRTDWMAAEIEPSLSGLSPELVARLGEEWERAGQLEHASIAAFARFTMQLLSLGAPPVLVELATRAMADETEHAKLCFAIASRYRGQPVGPGPLAIDGSLDETSLAEVVRLAVREGCVGETIAALEAAEAAEHARDPAIREALLRISADETRHAELAWRFVKWALGQGGASLSSSVRNEFERLASDGHSAASEPHRSEDRALLENGVVPAALRAVLRAEAMRKVIAPCVRALWQEAPRFEARVCG